MNTRLTRRAEAPQSNHTLTQDSCLPSIRNSRTNPSRSSGKIDDVLNFYDRQLVPKEKVCPFSDSSRPNPCTTHATPKKRKDIIQNHLLQVKQKGYDAQHPAKDPLWKSWEINKYWLVSRPPPLTTEEDKKAARSKAARKSYRTRLAREEREAADRKRQYEEGLISFNDYKFVLVGNKRRKAEKEYQEAQMKEQERRLEEQRVLYAHLENQLAELQAKQTPSVPLTAVDQQRFNDLTSSLKSIKDSKERVEVLRNEVINLCTEVVHCWGKSEKCTMEATDHSFMADMEFPSECNAAAFYQYAALLLAPMHWDDQPFKGTHVRSMKKALQVYAQDLEREIEDTSGGELVQAEIDEIHEIVANFNACCDVVQDEEQKAIDQGSDATQQWLDIQDKLWTNAKLGQRQWLDLVMGWRAPIQTARVFDKFTNVIREFRTQKLTDAEVSVAAQKILDGGDVTTSSADITAS